jgi:DNA-binding MarR family transcriptional regulator
MLAGTWPVIKRRLAQVAVDPDDKRGRLVMRLPAGHALLKSAVPIWERTHKAAAHILTTADAGSLRAGLRALA